MTLIELSGGPTTIRDAELNAMYRAEKDFDANSVKAKKVRRVSITFRRLSLVRPRSWSVTLSFLCIPWLPISWSATSLGIATLTLRPGSLRLRHNAAPNSRCLKTNGIKNSCFITNRSATVQIGWILYRGGMNSCCASYSEPILTLNKRITNVCSCMNNGSLSIDAMAAIANSSSYVQAISASGISGKRIISCLGPRVERQPSQMDKWLVWRAML